MKFFVRTRTILRNLFTKHLFITNVVTCGSLLGLGDCAVQQINIMFEKDHKYDFPRTGRMIIIGFILGPFNHYWYAFLDRALVGRSRKIVIKKIALDQVVAGTFFCSSFLYVKTILEGRGHEGAKKVWKDNFLKIYLMDWAFWPMAQFLNFRFVPSNFRVLYVSFSTLLWNSLLSYITHNYYHRSQRAKKS